MVPNAKVLMALGFAFVAGVSTTPLITTGRSAVEPGPASPAWEDPTTAKSAATDPARFGSRDQSGRAATVISTNRPPLPPVRPMDVAPRAERTLTAVRQVRPLVASNRDGLPETVTPLARRRPFAEVSLPAGAALKRAQPGGDASVRRPVQRLAGDFQGQGTIRSVRGGGDGLLRWLSE